MRFDLAALYLRALRGGRSLEGFRGSGSGLCRKTCCKAKTQRERDNFHAFMLLQIRR
jgi:hypothetical protein